MKNTASTSENLEAIRNYLPQSKKKKLNVYDKEKREDPC